MTSPPTPTLLGLPPELRTQIYEHLFTVKLTVTAEKYCGPHCFPGAGYAQYIYCPTSNPDALWITGSESDLATCKTFLHLLRACKVVYNEALPIFYQRVPLVLNLELGRPPGATSHDTSREEIPEHIKHYYADNNFLTPRHLNLSAENCALIQRSQDIRIVVQAHSLDALNYIPQALPALFSRVNSRPENTLVSVPAFEYLPWIILPEVDFDTIVDAFIALKNRCCVANVEKWRHEGYRKIEELKAVAGE